MPAHRIGKGWNYGHSHNVRRVATSIDKPIFDLLRESAVERGVGLATIARELIEDGLAKKVKK